MWPSETNRGESAVGARARVHDHALALSVPPFSHRTVSDEPGKDGCSLSRTDIYTPDEEAQSVTELVSTRAFPNPVSVEREFTNKGT